MLFDRDDAMNRIGALSGGERSRLQIAILILKGANFLLLDEPTNNLDIGSVETLEDALLDFPGTILSISHDRFYLDKICTRIIEIDDGVLRDFPGGYSYYQSNPTKGRCSESGSGVQVHDERGCLSVWSFAPDHFYAYRRRTPRPTWHRFQPQTESDWTRFEEPVLTGQYIASDPAILVDGDIYRMFYTCWIVPETGFVAEDVRAAICQATSSDGLSWENVEVDGATEGLMLRGIEGTWQEHLEAAFIVKLDGTYLLYYSGYETEGDPAMGFPAALSVAASTDGVSFERFYRSAYHFSDPRLVRQRRRLQPDCRSGTAPNWSWSTPDIATHAAIRRMATRS